jgi:hypothetical protein
MLSLSFIFSVIFFLFGISGILLTLSATLNSYQEKKLEYLAYKNKSKARNILDPEDSVTYISSEKEYYISHGLSNGAIDINFISGELKSNLLNQSSILGYLQKTVHEIVQKLSNIDFNIIRSQTKINLIKFYNAFKLKYGEFKVFLFKITEPVDDLGLEKEQNIDSATSASATSSRIKSLNSTIKKFSGKSQDFLKSKFSKNINSMAKSDQDLYQEPSRKSSEQSYTPSLNYKNSDETIYKNPKPPTPASHNPNPPLTLTKPSHDNIFQNDDVYEQLESEILEKLEKNLLDFELWKALANHYKENNEPEKAGEIYKYIEKHSSEQNKL